MRMTYELMTELGTCGDYRSKFRTLFPTSEYPEGVEITVENCVANAENFDWYWAASVLLTSDAEAQWRNYVDGELSREYDVRTEQRDDVRREELAAWQEKFGQDRPYATYATPDDARRALNSMDERYNAETNAVAKWHSEELARRFGELFQEPANHNENLVAKVRAAQERVERRERQELTDAQARVANATNGIANAQRELEQYTAELPLAERALVDAKARFTAREVERAERRAQDAVDAVAKARAAADEAQLAKEAQDASTADAVETKV